MARRRPWPIPPRPRSGSRPSCCLPIRWGFKGNVVSAGVNELVIPNYKQTWGNIRKIADAPANVKGRDLQIRGIRGLGTCSALGGLRDAAQVELELCHRSLRGEFTLRPAQEKSCNCPLAEPAIVQTAASLGTPLVDPFGRKITYLRVSVTDRCDIRCVYCMAEDMHFLPRRDLLTLEELDRLISAFVRQGVQQGSNHWWRAARTPQCHELLSRTLAPLDRRRA